MAISRRNLVSQGKTVPTWSHTLAHISYATSIQLHLVIVSMQLAQQVIATLF